MKKAAVTSVVWLPLLLASAIAETSIEPGLWRVTSNTVMNGTAMPPDVKTPCITPQQAGDAAKTFSPEVSTVNSACERTEYDATGGKLKWRLQCKGQLDMDVAGNFTFDSPVHYTATITTKGWMAGQLVNSVDATLVGERIGECR